MATANLAQLLFAAVTSQDGAAATASIPVNVEVTPEDFASFANSPWLDRLPAYVSFAPSRAYSSGNIVVAKFAVRVDRTDDGECILLPSPRSVYAAENNYTSGSVIEDFPFGTTDGPCRVNADSATLLNFEEDPEIGIMPLPYYNQKARSSMPSGNRGFSIKFTTHASRDLPREQQAAVNAMRQRIVEALCDLKDRAGVMGTGSMIITVAGFCGAPRNITRSKSEDERTAEKEKYGDQANDSCVGVEFPSGGFIMAARPVAPSLQVGFAANRVPANIRNQMAADMRKLMGAAPAGRRFVPTAQGSAVPQAPKSVSVDMAAYKKLDALNRIVVMGICSKEGFGVDSPHTVKLRKIVKAMKAGSSVEKACRDTGFGTPMALKPLRDQLFNKVGGKFVNETIASRIKSQTPVVEKTEQVAVVPNNIPEAPIQESAPAIVETPIQESAPAPATNDALMAFMQNAGGMEEESDFSTSATAPASAPQASSNLDCEEIENVITEVDGW